MKDGKVKDAKSRPSTIRPQGRHCRDTEEYPKAGVTMEGLTNCVRPSTRKATVTARSASASMTRRAMVLMKASEAAKSRQRRRPRIVCGRPAGVIPRSWAPARSRPRARPLKKAGMEATKTSN